jgi:hypothetical protein
MSDLDRYEKLAETAYDAIYDAGPGRAAKPHYEDACLYFSRAIAAADQLKRPDDAARLRLRLDHVRAVYDGQFRWI